MEFYRAVGRAEACPALQHVIATWWGQAMLDTDPHRTGCQVRSLIAEGAMEVGLRALEHRYR
jgi:hypothetical protein